MKIESLQAGRGIAALAVLLSHTADYMAVPQYFDYRPFGGALEFGFAGVDYFFVLSGFIIYFVNRDAIGRAAAVPLYLMRRVIRIYPIYWVLTVVTVLAYLLLPVARQGFELEPATLFTSLTLLPGGQTLVASGWTLVYEILFYAIFALFIARPRVGLVVIVMWQAATVAYWLGAMHGTVVADYLFYLRNLHFGLGMAAAHLFCRARVRWPRMLAALGSLGLAVLWFLFSSHSGALSWNGYFIALAFASVAVLLGLAQAERDGTLRTPKTLRYLGDASYSVYLVHPSAALVLTKGLLFAGAGSWMPPFAAFAIVTVGALASGIVLYALVEKPLLSVCRTWAEGRRDRR